MTAPALALLLLLGKSKPKPAPAPVLTRTYDAEHYAIALDLDTATGGFTTRTAVTVKATAPMSALELDVRELEIASVKQGEAELKFATAPGKAGSSLLTITLPAPLAAGESATVEITARGKSQPGGSLGLVQAPDPEHEGRTVWYTMFEPDGARRVFPCNDTPSDKATTEVAVTTDAALAVVGQGERTEDAKLDADGPAKHRVTWKLDKPQSPYLVAVAIGAFEPAPVQGASVPATIFVGPGQAKGSAFAAEVTRAALAYDDDFLHTPYPWSKYDQISIPEFPWGGMENTSATWLRASALVPPEGAVADRNKLARLIDHELAHQWFGDDVTPGSWKDVWLNESFATYLMRLAATDYAKNDSAFIEASLENRQWYFRFEDGPRSRPVVSDAVTSEDAFDAAAYQKGAAVLRMLEKHVGRDAFRKGLAAFLKQHAYDVASTDDLFAAISAASGKNLDDFKKAWLLETGYPVLKVSKRWLPGEKNLAITVEQRPNKAGGKKVFYPAPLTLVAHRTAEPAYNLEIPLPLDQPTVTIAMPLPDQPEWLDWNQGDVVLARLEANEKVEELALEATKDSDPMARLWADLELAGALADPDKKPQSAPPAPALEALAQALGSDHSPYVRSAVLRELARGSFKKLPASLTPVLMAQATAPQGLPDDPAGVAELRRSGYALLGKVDDPAVSGILGKVVKDPQAPLDLLVGAAEGLGHRGDAASVALLQAALKSQGGRGLPFLKAVLEGLATVEEPSVAADLAAQAKAHATSLELLSAMAGQLEDNRALLRSTPGTQLVAQIAADPAFNIEARARYLNLLDEVKTPAARAELTKLAKDPDARLSALAKQKLQRNFGAK